MNKPELVFYVGATLLEGPVWDTRRNVLYCVSIDQQMIYGFFPESGRVQSYPTDGPVGCVLVEDKGAIISAEKAGIHRIDPETGEREHLVQIEKDPELRYNDGILDPRGRLLIGSKTLSDDVESYGNLYSYDGENASILVNGTGISNGLAFSADGTYLYFIDTPSRKVAGYKYDLKSGTAEFDRYVLEIEGEGFPDGMCIDSEGFLWVAEWEGGQVCRWNPETGAKLETVKLPCRRVTSCCLGGEKTDTLYITTAKSDTVNEDTAGGLFRLKIT